MQNGVYERPVSDNFIVFSQTRSFSLKLNLNPFHATGLFLYLPENIRNLERNLFSGGTEREQWHEMGQFTKKRIYYSQLSPNLDISKCITLDYFQRIVVISPSNVTKEQEQNFAETIFKDWLLKSCYDRLQYSTKILICSLSSIHSH